MATPYNLQQIFQNSYDSATDTIKMEVTGGTGSAAPSATTPSITRVTSAASDTVLLATNANRKGVLVFNESTAILYLKYGTASSLTSYTVQIPANSLFELPVPIYPGAINGTWAAANGFAQITEMT